MRVADQQQLAPLSVRLLVPPGSTVRWRSPRLPGPVTRMSLVADGWPMDYQLMPRTNSCIGYGYGYGQGVALRLTDCASGKRVRYLRVRAVNAGLRPAHILLRFWSVP